LPRLPGPTLFSLPDALPIWWPKGQPLPPLVTAGRGPTPPVFGGPNTVLLIGGSPIDSPDVSGARFTLGTAVNEAETAGLAVTYLDRKSTRLNSSHLVISYAV